VSLRAVCPGAFVVPVMVWMLLRYRYSELAQWFGCLQSAGILCVGLPKTLSVCLGGRAVLAGVFVPLPPNLLGAACGSVGWVTSRHFTACGLSSGLLVCAASVVEQDRSAHGVVLAVGVVHFPSCNTDQGVYGMRDVEWFI